MSRKVLGHVLPGPLFSDGHHYAIEGRAWTGLTALAQLWQGDVVVLSPEGRLPTPPRGSSLRHVKELPFHIEHVRRSGQDIDGLRLDLATALHSPQMEFVTRSSTPVVLTSEFTQKIRRDIHRVNLRGTNRAKALLGLWGLERSLRAQMLRARSAQFNGTAAERAYSHLTRNALTFYDHRILASDVALSRDAEPWDGTRPLRLGFSGRLEPMKGPAYAVGLAKAAKKNGLAVELHIFGTGRLEPDLRAAAPPNVHFRGFLDFRDEWLPTVRDQIDIMVMPHVQGDPSCTYLEALGCGSPILGFDNETLVPLVENFAIGWTAPMGDLKSLYDHLLRIVEHPDLLHRARLNGLDLVKTNTFEINTQRRVAHLAHMART